MLIRPAKIASLGASLLLLSAATALAGQARVVAYFFYFSPSDLTVNPGDQVYWNLNNGHTATSGTDFSANGDGIFCGQSVLLGFAKSFSWKATAVDSVPYYCAYHLGMKAMLRIDPSATTPVADLRITEVEFAAANGVDRVRITNLGTATGYLGQWRFSFENGASYVWNVDPVQVDPGNSVRVMINFGGSSNQTVLYTPTGHSIGSSGAFAMYVPNNSTVDKGSSDPGSLDAPSQIVDYVEWGQPGQAAPPNRATAVAAGLWPAGDVIDIASLPSGGTGYSLSFCASRSDHGAQFWQFSRPNFGSSPRCTTPTVNRSWGRVKSLYR